MHGMRSDKDGGDPARFSEGNMMFKADMVAPCGLDCNICSQALLEVDPCPGCSGSDENKPEFCARYCGIILCEQRRKNGYQYCDECPDYPFITGFAENAGRCLSDKRLKSNKLYKIIVWQL